jgi:hypothetical protein
VLAHYSRSSTDERRGKVWYGSGLSHLVAVGSCSPNVSLVATSSNRIRASSLHWGGREESGAAFWASLCRPATYAPSTSPTNGQAVLLDAHVMNFGRCCGSRNFINSTAACKAWLIRIDGDLDKGKAHQMHLEGCTTAQATCLLVSASAPFAARAPYTFRFRLASGYTFVAKHLASMCKHALSIASGVSGDVLAPAYAVPGVLAMLLRRPAEIGLRTKTSGIVAVVFMGRGRDLCTSTICAIYPSLISISSLCVGRAHTMLSCLSCSQELDAHTTQVVRRHFAVSVAMRLALFSSHCDRNKCPGSQEGKLRTYPPSQALARTGRSQKVDRPCGEGGRCQTVCLTVRPSAALEPVKHVPRPTQSLSSRQLTLRFLH